MDGLAVGHSAREWAGRHVASLLREAIETIAAHDDGDYEKAARKVAIAAARYHTKIRIAGSLPKER